MLRKLLNFFAKDLAMDLGTANTLIYLRGQGIVLNEPSVVAIRPSDYKVLAVGHAARNMIGKHGKDIVTIRPLKDGVIADFEITSVMIKTFLSSVLKGRQLVRPKLVVAVPTGITAVEKRAVIEAAEQAGAGSIMLLEEPMAAAIGAGLHVDKPEGSMVVDIGGGTTEVAVISMFAVACSESVRTAGDEANEAIMRYIQKKHQMIISEMMAEQIKIKIGSALPFQKPLRLKVTGKEILTGIPRQFYVTDEEVREALREPTQIIVESIKRVFEKTPAELAADIHDKGIWLAGGGALLKGLNKLIERETGLPVHVDRDPLTAIVRGAGMVIEDIKFYRPVFIN